MKVTVKQTLEALPALERIFEAVPMDIDAASALADLLADLRDEAQKFITLRLKLYLDIGAKKMPGNGVQLDAIVRPNVDRMPDETDEAFAARNKQADDDYAARANKRLNDLLDLDEKIAALEAREIELAYEPLPFSCFPRENARDDTGKQRIKVTDLALARMFFTRSAAAPAPTPVPAAQPMPGPATTQ